MKNNKSTLNVIWILFLIFFSNISCSDDFLEVSNPNGVSDAIFGESIEELEGALSSAYGALRHHRLADVEIGNLLSDVPFSGKRGGIGQDFRHLDFIGHNLLPTNSEISSRWQALYRLIYRANFVLRFVEVGRENGLNSEQLLTIEAQAKFLRGVGHFYLYSTYNQGKIVLRMNQEPVLSDSQLDVSSAEQVIEAVRSDFRFALNNLPKNNSSEYIEGKVTAGTAAMLLGNSYLYENKFDEAIPFYEDVINNPEYGYSLVQNEIELLNMFSDEGEFNSESIFEIGYSVINQPQDSQWNEDSLHNRLAIFIGPPQLGSQGRIVPSNWLTLEFVQDHLKFRDSDAPEILERPVSLRASSMVALVNDDRTPYYFADNAAQRFSFTGVPAIFRKYTSWDVAENERTSPESPWKSGKNVILNRLPEAYLNLAECYLKGSSVRVNDAIDLVNTIRSRWKLGLFELSTLEGALSPANQVMEHIMYVEKPLELCLEGSHARAIDLRRWGIAKKRFENLSGITFNRSGESIPVNRRFKLSDFEYMNEEGNTAVRARSFLIPIEEDEIFEDIPENQRLQDEFISPALRYTTGFLPVPISETDFNENIK